MPALKRLKKEVATPAVNLRKLNLPTAETAKANPTSEPAGLRKRRVSNHYRLKKFAVSAAKRAIPVILSIAALGYVIYQTEPPQSLDHAATIQLVSFFLPLFLAGYCLLNLLPLSLIKKIIFSLNLTGLVSLLGLGLLNPLTILLVILVDLFLLRITSQPKLRHKTKIIGLTNFR